MAKEQKTPTAKKPKPRVKKKPLKASTQHNDFTGTIALDGRTTSTGTLKELATLCNVPEDYYPVGFYLHGVRHTDGIAEFQVAAVKGGVEVVAEYRNNAGPRKKLVVRMFGGKIDLNDLPKYFKMLSIAVMLNGLHGRKVEYDPKVAARNAAKRQKEAEAKSPPKVEARGSTHNTRTPFSPGKDVTDSAV